MGRTLNGWVVVVLLSGVAAYCIAEEITLTTYYPSPRGMYDELRAKGDVGIGKLDPPGARLEIMGGGATAATSALRIRNVDSTPLLEVQNGGNVGIGTTTPRGQFDVAGTGDIYLANSPITGTAQSLFLPGHLYIAPYSGGNISYLQARRSDNSGSTELQLRTYNAGALTEAVRINSAGNVGIGTAAPNAKLTLSDTASSTARLTLVGQEFYQPGNTSTDGVALLLGVNRTMNRQLWIGDSANLTQNGTNTIVRIIPSGIPIVDALATNGTTTSMIQIGNAAGVYMPGNVGIGTTSPVARLHVSGSIQADGGIRLGGITKSTWPSLVCQTVVSGGNDSASCPAGFSLTGGGCTNGGEEHSFMSASVTADGSYSCTGSGGPIYSFAICCQLQ